MKNQAVEATRGTIFQMWPEQLTIVTDPKHPLFDERSSMAIDESMVRNIMAIGVLEPVLATKETSTGKVLVVAGRQRVRCTAEANRRLEEQGSEKRRIPVVMRRGEGHELIGMMVSENAHRTRETPIVKAKKIQRFLDHGRSEEEAGNRFACGPGTVKNLLSLLDLVPELQAGVESGKITTSDGYKLAKLAPAEQLAKFLKLKVVAPKVKGVRREKAAKQIVSGPAMRSKSELTKLREKLATDDSVKENARMVALSVLDWALGDERSLESFMG